MDVLQNRKSSENKKFKGFSLVELLVVIAIIAILSVSAYIALGIYIPKAKDAKRQDDLGKIDKALSIYFFENDETYPNSLSEIPEHILPELPKDPSGKDYVYFVNYNRKKYQLAATLERGKDSFGFESYIIGNGSFLSPAGFGFYCHPTSQTFIPCTGGVGSILNGQVAQNMNGNGCRDSVSMPCSCIPYDPS